MVKLLDQGCYKLYYSLKYDFVDFKEKGCLISLRHESSFLLKISEIKDFRIKSNKIYVWLLIRYEKLQNILVYGF